MLLFLCIFCCVKTYIFMQVDSLVSVYDFRRLDEYPMAPNPSFLLPHLFFFPNRPPHGPYRYSPTCSWINILYKQNYVSAIGWPCLVSSHATSCVSEGAFPWLGLRRAGATMWGCGATATCRSDSVRVRCDRDSRAQVYLLLIFENFRQAWQKSVAKFGNARPRPKQDKYVRTRSTSVKKERRGFPSRDLIDTNPCFTCQLMRIFL